MTFERMFEVIWSSDQVHAVDALAATGDEGRSSLRKRWGASKQALIQRCPNGATHSYEYPAREANPEN